MTRFKDLVKKINKTHLKIAGIIFLILLAMALLWYGNSTSQQADDALVPDIYFEGEYRIADGDWQRITEGGHIPATRGDVTLRGNFNFRISDEEGEFSGIYRGEVPLAIYTNHVNITVFESGMEPCSIEMENPLYGSSHCGVSWTAYYLMSPEEEEVEILVHNPHVYGNENAIDEMLSTVKLWDGYEFEKAELAVGGAQRELGLFLVIVALTILGIALFSMLIHLKNIKIIWMLGLLVFFAGGYLAYSADGVSFWSESIASNTTILGATMIFYMLLLTMLIVYFLDRTKLIGTITVTALATLDAVFFVLPIVTDVLFYDTWVAWIITQLVAIILISVCLVWEFVISRSGTRPLYIGALFPLIAFVVDVICTGVGTWQGGVVSRSVFFVLFVIALVMVLKLIPDNINAANKARALEVEKITLNSQLAESRISTMMSQIRPHFIYNTLGSIEQLCKLDPPKAGELVHNFSKYLRGNFGELDNPKPILMSQEMEHVHHYISIENVRFPDMTFSFEMNSEDFSIPALTVQPIVENAIKHGLMKLPKGGTIRVVSYDTDTAHCISIVDDGVGFDTTALLDERKHIGLRNIRERLKVMVGGTLDIESTPGCGTKVVITIPKEIHR